MEEYLHYYHRENITAILKSPKKAQNHEILLDLTLLKESLPAIFDDLMNDYMGNAVKWIRAVKCVQQKIKDDLIDEQKSQQEKDDFKNKLDVKQNILLRVINHPKVEENFKLYPDDHFLKVVAFQAIIVKILQPKNRIMTKQFMCFRCKNSEIIYANRLFGYGFLPGRCMNKLHFETGKSDEQSSEQCLGKMIPVKFTPKKSVKTLQTQAYEVTVPHLEQHESFGDKTYIVDVEGKLINLFQVGQAVDIIGIVKTRHTSRMMQMSKFGIYALNIEPRQKIDLSKDLENNVHYRVLQAWHHVLNDCESELIARNQIVTNVFPKFFGAHAVKLACLLALCSGSGKSDSEKEADGKRDVFHLMLAGYGSAGKRTLLRSAAELDPKSTEVHSFGLTMNSLTARGFKLKKGGDNNIEGGVLVRANDSVSCFHDFHCLSKKYRRVLHEIMETQTVKIATANVKTNIKVNTSILAAHRIEKGKSKTKHHRDEQATSKMFKIEESLLNRFDLILMMNQPEKDLDYTEKVADFLFKEAMDIDQEEASEWPRERVTAHISLAKTCSTIEFTPEVDKIIGKYYLFCSLHPNIPKWRTTTRMYEGLRRITAAHTRLMLRKKTKIFDAITAILLSELSFPLGYLLDINNQLNDLLPGPDDECVEKVLWLLKLDDALYDVYVEEQSNVADDVEYQLIHWIHQQAKPKENLDTTIEEQLSSEETHLDTSLLSEPAILPMPTLNTSKTIKKQMTAKKTPKIPKKTKIIDKTPKEKSTIFKRNISCHEENSPKKSRVEAHEPLVNDAIVANLASLSKAFALPDFQQQITEKENNVDKHIEDELKALEGMDFLDDH